MATKAEIPTILEVNAETGDEIVRPMTADELSIYKQEALEAEERAKERRAPAE